MKNDLSIPKYLQALLKTKAGDGEQSINSFPAISYSGKVKEEDGAWKFSFSLKSSETFKNVQLVQPFEIGLDWKSYVIAPGVMYNGNRFIVSRQSYCPIIPTEGVSPDGPIIQTDVPRLTSDTGYRTELAANALTIPAVGFCDPELKKAFMVEFEVYGKWGVSGINILTLPEEPVRIEICLPVMRKKRYRFLDWVDVDNEAGMDILPGKTISYKVRIRELENATVPKLLTEIAEYAYACRGREKRRPGMSFAEAAEMLESKFDLYNWNEKNGYYQSVIGNSGRIMQTGWVGGGVSFYSIAMSGNPARRQRAKRMLDVFCKDAIAPSGYFHGLHDGKRWCSFGVKHPGCRALSLIRRPLECTRDVLKTIEVIRRRGESIEPAWENAARKNLDAMLDTVKRFGHLGYTVDPENGDVLWGDSCCGAFGIEPLVRGAAFFKKDEYLETARQLAEYYVSHFLDKGYTCGGVGDALMSADSESSFALLAGLVHLHAATGCEKHLEWARRAADLFSTWVLCYDAKLPEDSALGKLGIQPRGAVVANTQNQHGAPGICTASGRELLDLFEATGEERYLRLLEDIAQCIPQMIVRPGQEEIWKDLPPGAISERLMTMNGLKPCGETEILSTWPEISMLLTIRELPPSYVRGPLEAIFDSSRR